MAQPTVDTTEPTDRGTGRSVSLSQPSGTARIAGAAAMAAVTGAIRGRAQSGVGGSASSLAVPEPDAAGVEPAERAVLEPAELEPAAEAGFTSPDLLSDGPAELEASLVLHHGRWTAQRALAELPDTPAAAIEVIDGSLVVSSRRGIRHQTAVLEFAIALKRAARTAGYGMHPQIKVVVGDELVCPDLTVATRLGEDTTCVGAHEVVLVAEVLLADQGRGQCLDRTPIYAAGKIGHYLRLDFRGRDPVIALHELIDGEYRPVAVASVGARFTTSRPFDFAIDPVELWGRQAQSRVA